MLGTTQPDAALAERQVAQPKPLGVRVSRVLRRYPTGLVGGVIIIAFVVVGILASTIAPYAANQPVALPFLSPRASYLFGTDYLGRDLLSRVIYGSQISLEVGFLSVLFGTVGGGALGLASGLIQGWFDLLVQRLIDIMMALPGLLLALVVIAALGAGLRNVILAIAIAIIPVTTRLARSATLSTVEQPFVEAARSLGASEWRVGLLHVAPLVAPIVIVIGSVQLGFAIIAEAALSFLGLGVPITTPSWGNMLNGSSLTYMYHAPWMAIFPGLALMLVVLAFNLAGDALRDFLDARYRRGV